MTIPYLMSDERQEETSPYYIQAKVNYKDDEWFLVSIKEIQYYDDIYAAIEQLKSFVDRWDSDFEYQILDREGNIKFWKQGSTEIDMRN